MDAETRAAFDEAIDAGDRAHLLTAGSPVRGVALRVTLGNVDRYGEFHRRRPDVFLIVRGRRFDPLFELRCWRHRAVDRAQMNVAWMLPRWLVARAAIRMGAHATTGRYGDQIVPELGFMEALQRWDERQ